MKIDSKAIQKNLLKIVIFIAIVVAAGYLVITDFRYLFAPYRIYWLNMIYFLLASLLIIFGFLSYYFAYYRKELEVKQFYSVLFLPIILAISLDVILVEIFKFLKLGENGIDSGSFLVGVSISVIGVSVITALSCWKRAENIKMDLRVIFNLLTPFAILLMPILFIPGLRSLGVFFVATLVVSYLSVFLYEKLFKWKTK